MEQREVLGREAALLEQRDRERVAERHAWPSCSPSARGRAGRPPRRRSRRAPRRRSRASVESRSPVIAISGSRERRATRQQAQHLLGLAAVRDGDEHVAAHEHAEVAVAPLAGVQEERRRAGAGERRGDLPADDARLADAGDDDLAPAGEQEVDGARRSSRRAGRAAPASAARLDRRARGARAREARPSVTRGASRGAPRAIDARRAAPSSAGRSASARLVGAVARARASGSSCTSMKTRVDAGRRPPRAPAAATKRALAARRRPLPAGQLHAVRGVEHHRAAGLAQHRQRAHVGDEVVVAEARSRARSRGALGCRSARALSHDAAPSPTGERNCPFFRLTGLPAARDRQR